MNYKMNLEHVLYSFGTDTMSCGNQMGIITTWAQLRRWISNNLDADQ